MLNAFGEEEKKKLIEYVMKKDYNNKATALHYASQNGYEGIVKLLLDQFSEKEKDKVIEYVMKEDDKKRRLYIMLHLKDTKES